MTAPFCPSTYELGGFVLRCDLPPGHDGRHIAYRLAWEDVDVQASA